MLAAIALNGRNRLLNSMTRVLALFSLLAIFIPDPLSAQVIISISITPSSPTATDTIIVTSSGSTGTNVIRTEVQKSRFGSTIKAEVKVYTGLLTIIDQWISKDTLGLLPSGVYTYELVVTLYQSTGQGGFVVIYTQSLNRSFVVSPPTYVEQPPLATKLRLDQNYPNPFNPSTTIRYGLPARSVVRLMIYNVLGQVVSELVNSEQDAGYYDVQWTPNTPSGVYFYRLEAVQVANTSQRFVDVKKLLLFK